MVLCFLSPELLVYSHICRQEPGEVTTPARLCLPRPLHGKCFFSWPESGNSVSGASSIPGYKQSFPGGSQPRRWVTRPPSCPEPEVLADILLREAQLPSALSRSQHWLLVPIKKQSHSWQFQAAAKNTACSEKHDPL